MTQRSLHWDGASIGDADLLTVNAADGIGWRMSNEDYVSPFVDRMSRALFNGTGNRGVLYGYANALAVTGAATPISINTGAAIVYGLLYENTAAVTKVIVTPTNDTRNDYVVVRRDWSAQTARITVITGVEGGGVPSLTQSPAPTGTGVYDIPLATISVTTGGVITVTDAREYCAFPTSFDDDAFATANIVNDTVDFADRATRTRRLFLGGGDLQPNVNAGRFTYLAPTGYLTQVGPPAWGGGAANEEAWRATGTSSDHRGLYASFHIPADYASGSIITYVWWVFNAAVASDFEIVTSYQAWPPEPASGYYYPGSDAGSYTSTAETTTGVVSDVYRSVGIVIPASVSAGLDNWSLAESMIVYYYLSFLNAAGTEDIGIMGLELQYTGYV